MLVLSLIRDLGRYSYRLVPDIVATLQQTESGLERVQLIELLSDIGPMARDAVTALRRISADRSGGWEAQLASKALERIEGSEFKSPLLREFGDK